LSAIPAFHLGSSRLPTLGPHQLHGSEDSICAECAG
jgi:hypothetical protein